MHHHQNLNPHFLFFLLLSSSSPSTIFLLKPSPENDNSNTTFLSIYSSTPLVRNNDKLASLSFKHQPLNTFRYCINRDYTLLSPLTSFKLFPPPPQTSSSFLCFHSLKNHHKATFKHHLSPKRTFLVKKNCSHRQAKHKLPTSFRNTMTAPQRNNLHSSYKMIMPDTKSPFSFVFPAKKTPRAAPP